ncbi:MAG: hypothetical protein ACP5PQ_07040 [Thermoproteota archaeon]
MASVVVEAGENFKITLPSEVRARSLLSKATAQSKKDGYRYKLSNGVECVVLKDRNDDGYWFNFKVAEENIGILYGRRALFFALDRLQSSQTPSNYGIEVIRYRGKHYYVATPTGELLLKAVAENQKPEVIATVDF